MNKKTVKEPEILYNAEEFETIFPLNANYKTHKKEFRALLATLFEIK